MPKQIILIGGAPTVGKSSLAQALSTELGLPWVSTDQIREVMRSVASKKDYPGLFCFSGYTPETFLTKYTPRQTSDTEYRQCKEIWHGVKAFIDIDYTWPDGFIVEGIGILPHLVKRDFGKQPNIKAIFIGDNDEARMRKVVYERGIWTHAKDYSEDIKEKEVQWAKIFNQRIKAEATEHKYPWLEIEKNQSDLAKIIKALGT